MEEIEVVVAHTERAALRVGEVFLKIDADQTRAEVEVEGMRTAPNTARCLRLAGRGSSATG